MPTLIVEFHCMCLFIPDPKSNSVHVLMPKMDGHAHTSMQADNGGEKVESRRTGTAHKARNAVRASEAHVVRMLHRSFSGQPQGRPMEGWSLVLEGTGATDLELNPKSMSGAELPDLTEISGETVDRSLVSSESPAGVISRVTLGAGKLTERGTDPYLWTLGGKKDRILANTATWVIPGVKDQLDWCSIGATGAPPISRLSELWPEADDLYRINIHHETERTLPGKNGPLLQISEMRRHFAAFYGLLGLAHPIPTSSQGKFRLPQRQLVGGGGSVLCKKAMAQLAP